MDKKKTIAKKSEYEIEIKHSRFIGCAFPVKNTEQAEAIISEIRNNHRKAKHNVYAYIIGSQTGYSDDGEPKKTAGLPIFDFLRKEELTDVLVVVTRYFGGILLGTGGLVKAYTDAAKGAVLASGIVYKLICQTYRFEVDYSDLAKLKAKISELIVWDETEYGEKTFLTVAVKSENEEKLLKEASEILKGKAPEVLGKREYSEKIN